MAPVHSMWGLIGSKRDYMGSLIAPKAAKQALRCRTSTVVNPTCRKRSTVALPRLDAARSGRGDALDGPIEHRPAEVEKRHFQPRQSL